MIGRTLKDHILSDLRLLVTTRYIDLLLLTAVLSIPMIAFYLAGATQAQGSGLSTTYYVLIRTFLSFVLFPAVLLTTMYIYRSVLRADTASFWYQCRQGIGDVIEYLFLVAIEYGGFLFVLGIIDQVLVATHLVEKGNVLLASAFLLVATTFGGFIFIFSMPLLVESNISYRKNILESLRLFRKHWRSLLPMMALAALVGCVRLPDVLQLAKEFPDKLLVDFVSELVTILFYLITMNCFSYYRGRS